MNSLHRIDPAKIRGTPRDRKILENIPLVFFLLKKYYSSFLTSADLADELLATGCIGLIKAVDRYNGSTAFSHYAAIAIRGEIGHYLRDKYPMIRFRAGKPPEVGTIDGIDIPSDYFDPYGIVDIEMAIESFPDSDRRIILGRLAEKPIKSIALEIGKTPLTVSRRLEKIRVRFQEIRA